MKINLRNIFKLKLKLVKPQRFFLVSPKKPLGFVVGAVGKTQKDLWGLVSFAIISLVTLSCKNEKPTAQPAPISNTIEMKDDINRIEPPNWWVGFKNQNLQLLVHHPNIGKAKAKLDYAGVSIQNQHQAKSLNYLFLDIEISESAKAGQFNIGFTFEDGKKLEQTYELKSREQSAEDIIGFESSDVIYLITPDRFANVNPENDIVDNLKEKHVDRTEDYARHGGDIEGIIQHLDYIEDMGFTAIWSSPLLINDMPNSSYHGYAITDYYKVDPRFGTLEDYCFEPYQKQLQVYLPKTSNWCLKAKNKTYKGGQSLWIDLENFIDDIPVFIREGAFIPEAKLVQTTDDYSLESFDLQYYFNAQSETDSTYIYHDDGMTKASFEKGKYEKLHIKSTKNSDEILIQFEKEIGSNFKSEIKLINLKIYNLNSEIDFVEVNGDHKDFNHNKNVTSISVDMNKTNNVEVNISLK